MKNEIKMTFMKLNLFLAAVISLACSSSVIAQDDAHVKWSFYANKINEETYEVHMHASIDDGWHIFTLSQPENAIGRPPQFSFTKNPLVTFVGKMRENGKVVQNEDKTLGISENQFLHEADFVQTVKVKANAKMNLSGRLLYQVCTDERCVFPPEMAFSVPLM